MTKVQRPKGSKKRKGGRQPVAFVEHPDTGEAVNGLRIHKSTGRYYRIGDDRVSRHYLWVLKTSSEVENRGFARSRRHQRLTLSAPRLRSYRFTYILR